MNRNEVIQEIKDLFARHGAGGDVREEGKEVIDQGLDLLLGSLDELKPLEGVSDAVPVAVFYGNKGPFSYEAMSDQDSGKVYRVRDADDNAISRSYLEDNAKLIVYALNQIWNRKF